MVALPIIAGLFTRATPPAETAPVVKSGQSFSVPEDATIGTVVGIVALASGTATSFAITDGNTGTAFAISNAGVITVAAALDYETLASYSLTTTATNGIGTSPGVVVGVSVTDVIEAASDSLIGENGTDFLISESGTDYLKQEAIVAPVVTAGQTFTVNASDPNGTVLGTVATTGGAPTSFSIGGTGLSISSAGVVTKNGSPSTGNYAVTATNAGGTSPSTSSGPVTG